MKHGTEQDLFYKHETNEMAQFYYKLKAGLAASPHELTNPRLSCPSLIFKEPEFNLEYLRFAF
jgi:hypothetical protein